MDVVPYHKACESTTVNLNNMKPIIFVSTSALSGPTVGGTWLVLKSQKKLDGKYTCYFGRKIAMISRWISQSQQIECMSPPNDAGITSIKVELDEIIVSNTLNFTYFEDVDVSSIFPSSGVGGTPLI